MDGGGFRRVVNYLIVLFSIVGAVIVGIVWGIVEIFSTDEIRSNERLEPIRIELEVTRGILVDTVYIYKID